MDDYRTHGKWVGNATLDENCTNPEALFESIVIKTEDLIGYIVYFFIDGTSIEATTQMTHVDT